MKKILLTTLTIMGVAGLTGVQAQLLDVNFIDASINIDYGGGTNPAPSAMSGAAVIGSSGDVWNGLGGFTYASYPDDAGYTNSSLEYADGSAASNITVSLFAPSGTYCANANTWGNYSPFSWPSTADMQNNVDYGVTPYAKLMASCLVANTTTTNGWVEISGLTPGSNYDIYVYSSSDQGSSNRTSTFTVNNFTQTSTYNTGTNLTIGVSYLIFPSETATAGGTLTILFGGEINSESDFNGFQIQPSVGPPPAVPPTLSPLLPSKTTMATNTALTTTVTAGSGSLITNVVIVTTTSSLVGASTTVTNSYSADSAAASGFGTGTVNVTFPLTSNLLYTAQVTALDNHGLSKTGTSTFDTLAPALVIEASDFNFNNGQFIDTPPDGGVWLYTGVVGVQGTDENKAAPNNSTSVAYRGSLEPAVIQAANPASKVEQKFVTAAAEGDTTNNELELGYNGVGDWANYSRSYGSSPTNSAPAGTYDVYLYMVTDGTGVQSSLSQVTSDPTQPNQTTTPLGNFGTASFSLTDSSWSQYEYVPLVDKFGNLASVTLGSGVQTLRSTVVGNPNLGYYILMPVTPVLTPVLLFDYPDGLYPFEATNSFTFTVGPANGSNILSSGIDVVLNGVDITSSPHFTLTSSGGSWTGSYPITSNAVYSAVINVTNTAGLSATIPVNFDTFDINNYQWEAVDYDFTTNGVSGLFIDNPVPTGESTSTASDLTGTLATNSYFGYPADVIGDAAQPGVDIGWVNVSGQYQAYRFDSAAAQPSSDYVRPKFVAAQTEFSRPNIGPFNLGYFTTGSWVNYTHHYPTNTYNVWGRLAGGGGAYSNTLLSKVTSGYGTATQSSNVLGSFSDPNASGWQSWHWIPLLDNNGKPAVVSLGGQDTLTLTSGNNVNVEFFMLVPAASSPQTIVPSLVGGQLNLSFSTAVGHTYTIVSKTDLTSPTWTPVGSPIVGSGSVTNVTVPLSGPQGFYTIGVQ